MKAIAAMAENRAIGKDGGLPWASIKNDFKWFKEFTMGQNLVAGNSTFLTLPPLKDRNIYFLSRPKAASFQDVPVGDYGFYKNAQGAIGKRLLYVSDVIYGIRNVDVFGKETLWKLENPIIIGGAKTYELFFPHITDFYVTHVKGEYEADTFMPPFEHLFSKQEVVKEFDGHKVIRYSR
jgi:dihydrofolate reductase